MSMVVATYNVAPYIEAFFESLLAQSDGIDALEVIIVNDGSTDQSGIIAQEWAARYPSTFHYIYQENQGVAAARNVGLQHAKGEWVCFPDPDDFLSSDYLAQMRAEISRPRLRKLLAVTAPLIFYHEASDTFTNDHPLRARFGSKVVRYNSTDMGHVLLPHTSSTFMRRSDILEHDLNFDCRIRPSFEDAHFIIRLLLRCPGRTISFLSQPVYYYRKRQAGNSLVDNVVTNPEWYGPHLRHAYLSLLQEASTLRGHVPTFVQGNVIFSLLAKLRYLTGPNFNPTVLCVSSQSLFMTELQNVMDHITTENLERIKLPGFYPLHRIALIACFKQQTVTEPRVVLEKYPEEPSCFNLRWVIGSTLPDTVILKVDHNTLPDTTRTNTSRQLFGQTYARIFSQKVSIEPGQCLSALTDNKHLPIWYKKQNLGIQINSDMLEDVIEK